eukprot:TRINITY_DN15145_c0_g1_i1.p1 TRINITY_DN15145_c0_g1~~TRINITY_DN15145_c0_g1_i1.p1  ORF type:complete len:385 (+),score=48.91 TRINITY_DN15145_c0_g1_i1:143-1297(+)
MIRRPPRSTHCISSAASDVYKRQVSTQSTWGKQLFVLAEIQIRTFSPEIIEDLQLENKLRSEYTKLLASAQIMFKGQLRTIPQMRPFELSQDRAVRKKASETKWDFFVRNEARFDEIYDKLVKVRTGIAQKLGYKNFIELGYLRMKRVGYDAGMAAEFRQNVAKYIVPLAVKLKEHQRQRLGLDSLKYYDLEYNFNSGNAAPKGEATWILRNGQKMYRELSTETKEFFEFMTDNELMDLVSKQGKVAGGYCTFLSQYKAPFIFSNFNGTEGDIDVLTHEAGHAFQVYMSKDFAIPEYNWPTSEACEIHSMSMEFFTWPWMELFFLEEADKYRYSHLSGGVTFIPYGVSVDEFQHEVYARPEMTPAERKACCCLLYTSPSPRDQA